MKSNSRIWGGTLLIILFSICPWARSHSAERLNIQQEESRRTQELQKIGAELRAAILRKDLDTLLKYINVGPDGFESYETAKIMLQMRTNSSSCLLFDTKCWQEELSRHGGAHNPFKISLLEFFEKHPNLRMEIRFFGNSEAEQGSQSALDFAQIFYIVPGSSYDVGFPAWTKDKLPQRHWGKQYVEACLRYTNDGWRYYSGAAGIFVCSY